MTKAEKARLLRPFIEKAAQSLNDEDALEAKELYGEWKPGMECVKDTRLRYKDKLYRVRETHTSQADWTPDVAASLFIRVRLPDEIEDWKKPGEVDEDGVLVPPYMAGDKMRYIDSKIYESLMDNNVWSPEEYPAGWKLVG